jgi:hypothetical protein
MARLNRSIMDGHYFIRVSQSKGTWQVSDEGSRVLGQHGVTLPRPGDLGVDVGELWRYLWDKGLLFKHDIPYAHNSHDWRGESEGERLARLPLLLRPLSTQLWSLELEIPGDILAEAQERRAFDMVIIEATVRRTWLRELQRLHTVRVVPQVAPYVVSWFDTRRQKLDLSAPCFSAGLNDTALGNVFAEGQEKAWRRCLAGSSVPFWGTLYWLAHEACMPAWPGWPGVAQRWGNAQGGWLLWRLTTTLRFDGQSFTADMDQGLVRDGCGEEYVGDQAAAFLLALCSTPTLASNARPVVPRSSCWRRLGNR